MIEARDSLPPCPSGLELAATTELEVLLNLARGGNEQAFTRLLQGYEPGLRKTAKRVLGPLIQTEIDVEDLIQSVHWSLWVGLRERKLEVDSVERLLAMARTILRRKVARVWRTLERRRRLETNISASIRSRNAPLDLDEAARQLSAEDHFEHLCLMMSETEKRLIELRILGYSTAEAAREMGRDPESLRMTLARLRKKLRESGIFPHPSEPK